MGNKKNEVNDSGLMTVRLSIGVKMITIIIIIVLVSLGSITALVSVLIRGDLRIQAEENNFEVNRRSATLAGYTLANMRSYAVILMQSAGTPGSALAGQAAEIFFEENQELALLLFSSGGNAVDLFVNSRFFISHDIDPSLADSFPLSHGSAFTRAASGETVLLNAAPWFRAPLIALLFPWHGGVGGIIFSSGVLNDSFGSGANQSCLLNDSGDILIHGDYALVEAAANIAGNAFTKLIWESPQRNAQILYTGDDGLRYFGAFTKLDLGGAVVTTSIEYDKVFEGIAATTRRNIYLTFTVLCISILLIWFFAKSISVPLKVLAAAARSIEGGQFQLELEPKGRDEIGVLTASFAQMCTALGIFGRFTNREIAVRAMRGDIKPGGLPKHATIFFSDIRGFTEKSEQFTNAFGEDAPNRIVYWLNEYLTRMVECVERTGGVVDKFIGDAVMAHWGTAYTAGSPQEDAYNCIKAALMMRKSLYEMNKTRKPNDGGNPPIVIGCGINTGMVTAGQIGSDLRMEYTVIGDPVNLASRVESLTKPLALDILITENTWKLVKNHFITEEMPAVTVKGKARPVRIFAVVNFAGMEKGPRTLSDVRKLLGIEAPDISKVDINAVEKKYSIGDKAQQGQK